jgi:FlaA1/EpsC-like NDP-sugar epimerase
MSRYFMTIPEAVQLIIRAGSLIEPDDAVGAEIGEPGWRAVGRAASGEVFVLEMGEPVKIIDLAETMIRLSGLEPERDIAIEIVGARPGEKFHEDLFNPNERPQPTPAQKILRAEREALDPAWVEDTFSNINLLVLEGDAAVLAQHVSRLAGARGTPGPSGARVAT